MSEPKVEIHLRDCIAGMADVVPDNSIDLIVTSIPFEQLFSYSGKPEDVGNSESTVDMRAGRFALNMRFFCAEAFRVLRHGTNFGLHIQTLLAFKNQHGFMGRRDFRGAMIDVFGAAGFHWIGETAIPKDPQQAAQRLNLHSLQFKTGYARSATNLAPNVNDYILIFQKPGEVAHPVRCIKHPTNPNGWITSEDWIKWASGCWDDILQIDILEGWKSARESDQERHVCPLQLSVIYRLVQLYTNPRSIQPDVCVLDPFAGIGSTQYVCIGGECKDGQIAPGHERNTIGFELKESYFSQAISNCELVKKNRAIKQKPVRSLPFGYDEQQGQRPPEHSPSVLLANDTGGTKS